MNKVIFHSPCYGAGISTLVANTGVSLARNGIPVLLGIDAGDSIGKHFSSWNPPVVNTHLHSFHGVHKQQVENQLFVIEHDCLEHLKTPDYQASGGFLENVTSDPNAFLLLKSADKTLPDISILDEIDWLIIVITPNESSFSELARLINQLSEMGSLTPRLKILVILNKYNPASQLCQDVFHLMQASLALIMFKDPLLLDESVNEAVAHGLPLIEHAPYSPLIDTLNKLAQYLIKWEENTHAAA